MQDYSTIVQSLSDYYGANSEQVWQVINQYGLSPAQAMDLLPQQTVAPTADGVYRLYNNAGDVIGYNNNVTVPVETQRALPAVNSNVQTGTAEYAVKTQFAGNSVIDSQGNIQTETGLTEYKNGVQQPAKALSVVSYANTALSGWSVGMSLGKAITKDLYERYPAIFSCYNPDNWNSMTANMSDKGIEGVAKKVLNYILKIDPTTGNTQAYMPADTYHNIAHALAQMGMFDSGGMSAPTIVEGDMVGGITLNETWVNALNQIQLSDIVGLTGRISPYAGKTITGVSITTNWPDALYYTFHYGRIVYFIPISSTPPTGNGMLSIEPLTSVFSSGSSGTVTHNGVTKTYYFGKVTAAVDETGATSPTLPSGQSIDAMVQYYAAFMHLFGEVTPSLPGVGNQEGATVPNITSTDTKQQVIDKIHGALPGLNDNRLEQTVVQDDGTTKTIVYYPVPMPNDTEDVTTTDDATINTNDTIKVVLPDGETLTLPDGTEIEGDGVTEYELPPGEYDLPAGTTIINNYIYNTENTIGGSQANPEVTDQSLEDLLKLIATMLTSSEAQSSGADAEQETPTETENPPDTGSGGTPSIVIPVGTASALWTVYNPSLAEINSFGSWLWSSNFIDQLLKMFNDPMQAIIGLHKTYINPITGSRENIHVGYLDSGVSSLTVPTQYSTVDCGTVNLPEYFGNVFDYSPYTRVYIYLPFIGFKELDVSQVMRSTIGVKYHGDAYTGTGLAEVSVIRDAGAGGVLYAYGCECAVRYPLSQGSYLGIIGSIAGLGMSGLGIATANPSMVMGGLGKFASSGARIEQSGGFAGNSGAMGIKKPYLVIMRPQTAMPANYQHFSGIPSSSTVQVGNTTGLIRVRECHVDIPSATIEENLLIETSLREGVLVS